MLKKGPMNGGKCEVTFGFPSDVTEGSVQLCGEFNDWSLISLPMELQESGNYEITLLLEAGNTYRYRYFVDGLRWENDWEADEYVTNEFGGEDSALVL